MVRVLKCTARDGEEEKLEDALKAVHTPPPHSSSHSQLHRSIQIFQSESPRIIDGTSELGRLVIARDGDKVVVWMGFKSKEDHAKYQTDSGDAWTNALKLHIQGGAAGVTALNIKPYSVSLIENLSEGMLLKVDCFKKKADSSDFTTSMKEAFKAALKHNYTTGHAIEVPSAV